VLALLVLGGVVWPSQKPGIETEENTMMGNHMFDNTMGAGHWLWMLVFAFVVVIPVWRICRRTGYPGWLGLLTLIPFVNLIFLYFIAFADWPKEKSENHKG